MSSDFLTQEEIDALLRDASSEQEGDAETEIEQGARTLTDLERDTLAEVGNIAMGSAATALSTLLNRRVWITVPNVRVTDMQEVVEQFPVPCVIVRVEYVKGLEGINLMIIKEQDAAVIASLMMGESGENPPETLDELALSAVAEAMNQMMGSSATAMGQMFGEVIEISPPLTQYEKVESSQELSAVGSPLVQVSFRMEIEDLVDSELVQLIEYDFAKQMVQRLIPQEVEPTGIMEQPTEALAGKEAPVEASAVSGVGGTGEVSDLQTEAVRSWEPASLSPPSELHNVNIDLIKNIPVRIRAVLGRTKLPIENVLRLTNGSIIELDTLEGEPIEVLANDTLIARGEVVVVGEQFGIRITEIATPVERINSVNNRQK